MSTALSLLSFICVMIVAAFTKTITSYWMDVFVQFGVVMLCYTLYDVQELIKKDVRKHFRDKKKQSKSTETKE